MGLEEPQKPGVMVNESKKRKTAPEKTSGALSGNAKSSAHAEHDSYTSPTRKKGRKVVDSKAKEEKRLRRFRPKAPQSYQDKLFRATTQRMFVIDRKRGEDELTEIIELADNLKGNQCKHIIYVLHNVLKAPEKLQYQLAFLSHELEEIFSAAPLLPSVQASEKGLDSKRKAIEGDCPICFTDLLSQTEIVYCKAACGNNVHQTCFEQWAKSQSGREVRCVYCRTPWQGDEEAIKRIVKEKKAVNAEGYVNVATELGLSGRRDYSTYHPFWVGEQLGEWY